MPSFKVIIVNEAIAPLAKSQNFTQSHICIVAGKNVFPTTEKLVWTNSQNLESKIRSLRTCTLKLDKFTNLTGAFGHCQLILTVVFIKTWRNHAERLFSFIEVTAFLHLPFASFHGLFSGCSGVFLFSEFYYIPIEQAFKFKAVF